MPQILRCLILISLSFSLSPGRGSPQSGRSGKVSFQRECPCKNRRVDTTTEVVNTDVDVDEPRRPNPVSVDGELDQLFRSHLNLLLPNNAYPVYMYQQVPSTMFPGCIMVPVILYPSMSIPSPLPSLTDSTPSVNLDSSMYQSLSEIEKMATQQFYMDILHKYTKFYTSQDPFNRSQNSPSPAANDSNGQRGQDSSQNHPNNGNSENSGNDNPNYNENMDNSNGNNYITEDRGKRYNNNDSGNLKDNNNNNNNNIGNSYSQSLMNKNGKSNSGHGNSYNRNDGSNYISSHNDTSTNSNDARNSYKEGIIFNN